MLHSRSIPACVVLGLAGAPASSLSELVVTLRNSHEECPIIGFTSLIQGRAALAQALVAVSRAGISRLVFTPCDTLAQEIEHAIAEVGSAVTCQRVRESVRGLAAPITLRVIDAGLSYPGRAPSVGQLATSLSMSRRTLIRRLAGAHQPPPHIIMQWIHTLLAARLLEGSHRSLETISQEAGCANPRRLRRLLRYHLLASPRQLRVHGSYTRVIGRFAAAFGTGVSTEPTAVQTMK
jgi:AraC-like DNA-binding protein